MVSVSGVSHWRWRHLLGVGLMIGLLSGCAQTLQTESAAQKSRRLDGVEKRRAGIGIICHRGASEFAHENTLEAYRASFELGADGNEIDVRMSKDGVLFCFHDDMLDRILHAYGRPEEFTWQELRGFRFRNPGPFQHYCRIPTLEEVLLLHRRHAGLIHLDLKQPGIDAAVAKHLDELDMWEHVISCDPKLGPVITSDSRFKPRRYKAGLYLDHSEVDPKAIAEALEKPGEDLIVDDPRGAAVALGRKIGPLSREPVTKISTALGVPDQGDSGPPHLLIPYVHDDVGWDRIAQTPEERSISAGQILRRANAAERIRSLTPEAISALKRRIERRSLHPDWLYHGLDGEMALRTLITLRAPGAIEIAREVLYRDDPALEPLVNREYNSPRSWVDWRLKTAVFPALRHFPGPESERLCRQYLALSDETARAIGPPLFEEAGRALLAISPRTKTALELMNHRLPVVRGRAILDCLSHADEPWAETALRDAAPHALAYQVH